MRAINGIETVELLASADPALAAAARQRGRVPVFERTAGTPSVQNGIEGVIFGTSASGPGTVLRLDSADPALALAARQRGQRAIVVVNSAGAVVPSTPAEAWYEEGTSYDALAAVMDFNNDRYALPTFGSELVTNGTFAADASWGKGAGWTIASGVATKAAGSATGLTQAITLTAGVLYAVTYTISGLSASTLLMQFTGGTTVNGTVRSANGSYTDYMTAVTGNTTLQIFSSATTVASIDDVSVKEVVLTATGRTYGSELVVNGAMVESAGAGAEIFTNPNMDSGTTGWSPFQCTLSTGTGSIIATLTATSGSVSQGELAGVVAGGIYELRIRAKRGTATDWTAQFIRGATGSYANLMYHTNQTSTSYTDVVIQVVAPATDLIAQVVASGAIGQTIEIDSMSLKRLDAAQFGWKVKTPVVGSEQMIVSGGTLNLTGDGTNAAYADQSFTTVNGQVYEFTFTTGATNTVLASVGTSQGGTQLATFTSTASSTQTIKFAATGTTTWLRFSRTAAGLATVDNVSIKNLTAIGTYPKRAATFDECFAYTAASTAARTYTDVNGVMQSDLAVNARRMTYANAKRQLRLENAGTNLCLRSAEIDNAAWTKTNVVETANAIAAPDGTTTAERILESTNPASYNRFFQTITTVGGTTYTLSAYVKDINQRYVTLGLNQASTATNWFAAKFDLTAGTSIVGNETAAAPTSGMQALANGWWRIWVTGALAGSVSSFAILGVAPDNSAFGSDRGSHPVYTGTGKQSYWWGAQLEASAFATDYIPTTSAAVTRAIETARLSPLLEAVLQRAQGTTLVRMDLSCNDTTNRPFFAATGTGIFRQGGTASDFAHWNGTSSVTVASPASNNAPNGVAFGFDAVGRAITANSATVVSDANIAGSRTQIYLARDSASGFADGYYDLLGIAPERLPNTDLQALAVAAT